jgi:hypothetical protein
VLDEVPYSKQAGSNLEPVAPTYSVPKESTNVINATLLISPLSTGPRDKSI